MRSFSCSQAIYGVSHRIRGSACCRSRYRHRGSARLSGERERGGWSAQKPSRHTKTPIRPTKCEARAKSKCAKHTVIKASQASVRDFAIRMLNLWRGIASRAAAHDGGEAFSGKMARGGEIDSAATSLTNQEPRLASDAKGSENRSNSSSKREISRSGMPYRGDRE